MSVLVALDREWVLLASGPRARRSLIRWSRAHRSLVGLVDFDALLERRRDPAVANDVLGALASLAPDDELASRVLLQAMMPGLVRLAQTTGYDDPAAIDEMVSLAWERIRTYPATRQGSVAANILWDTRKRYRRHRLIDAPKSISFAAADVPEPTADESVDTGLLGRVIVDELHTAHRAGVISERALALIVRTRIEDEPLADIAAEQAVTVHRLAQCRWRAERRLRALPWAS